MAERKVIAYCLHEREFAAVSPLMKDPAWTASYAVGSMDDEAIQTLESQGIIVEIVREEPAIRAEPTRGGQLHPADARAGALAGSPLPPALHPTKKNVFVVGLTGPVLLEEWRQAVEALDVRFIEARPGNQYTARLSLAQVGHLRTLPFVVDVHLLSPDETTGLTFTPAGRTTRGFDASQARKVTFDVLLHTADDLDDVRRWLVDRGIAILAGGRRKLRVELAADSLQVREIQALPEVAEVQEYVQPTLANDRARRLVGLPVPIDTGVPPKTGEGEIVGVADSGLDKDHPAFAGKLVKLVARGRPLDASDPHGHGTHVAGSVLGEGGAAAAAGTGVAPGAHLVFQSIMDAHGGLGGLPVDLSELFDEAYQAGARIHNNSWSADTKSFYTFSSREVDEFVFDHPDMLVVIAAGNGATACDPFNASTGYVDWQSIGSPATAKNALTVGASRSDRMAEGLTRTTYKQFDPDRFADPPIGTETISGRPECLAAFSGRGPCDSNRIKPDLVAPGTDILSARASTALTSNFWGLPADPELAAYGYMGGTSMAAPLVSGCAALAREYYRRDCGAEPSAALLKATLVNSTKWLSGSDAIADRQTKAPNYHQGFGAVFMQQAVPNPTVPWMQLAFIDTWKDQAQQLAGTGDRRRFAFQATGGAFLRLCLTWTDPPPGPGVQNVLAVILEGPVNPPKIPGNSDRPRCIDPVDRDNNVQIVRIENPPPGNYLAVVFARNMLRPPQDYALVVTGALNGGLIAV